MPYKDPLVCQIMLQIGIKIFPPIEKKYSEGKKRNPNMSFLFIPALKMLCWSCCKTAYAHKYYKYG